VNLKEIITHYIKKKRSTILGVGPMSQNCIDATIEISEAYNIPILLIASRRQIESEVIGNGYVNKWSTRDFSNYIKKKNKKKNVIVCRDHGGPWQGDPDIEKKLNETDTIANALQSFYDDIDNDFKILHIDTSFRLDGKNVSYKKSFELFTYFFNKCREYAKKKNKKIYFEIGTEEQSSGIQEFLDIERNLKNIYDYCKERNIEQPIFVVLQTGTKVMEMRNVGAFEFPLRIKNQIPVEIQLLKAVEISEKYNFFLKEHNADYLTNDSLAWHPKMGINAVNVAPEFGVEETKALVELMNEKKQKKIKELFLETAYNSHKWKKWIINKKKCSDYDKALIAGHYIFSQDSFKKIIYEFIANIKISESTLNKYLKNRIKIKIFRYVNNFNLL